MATAVSLQEGVEKVDMIDLRGPQLGNIIMVYVIVMLSSIREPGARKKKILPVGLEFPPHALPLVFTRSCF